MIMLRPAAFGFNPETAETNAFQRPFGAPAEVARRARAEVEAMADALHHAGVAVELWEDTPSPIKPDAPFVNNWLSTHADGQVHLYPMATPSRRAEVRDDLVTALGERFAIAEVIDWRARARADQALEGTGSLVIDADRDEVYACRSARTDPELARAWADARGLRLHLFTAEDREGAAIYHTNVLLSLGAGFSLCGLDRIAAAERPTIAAALEARGPIVRLSAAQLDAFAGNMLQLIDRRGAALLVLSTTALRSLTPDQRQLLERYTALLPVDIPTIEAAGGGSARCLLAENFLARR
ncbi:MAG: hypothetical protein KC486_08955 [Myxococcales bacterium]|nr:hypothetical protein [Myxococcales bacterium]